METLFSTPHFMQSYEPMFSQAAVQQQQPQQDIYGQGQQQQQQSNYRYVDVPDWLAFQLTGGFSQMQAINQNQPYQFDPPSPTGSDYSSDLESPTFKFPLAYGEGQFVPAHFAAPSVDFSSPILPPAISPRGQSRTPPPPPAHNNQNAHMMVAKVERMEPFPSDQVSDFKHVIYNLLADYHNHPERQATAFVQPLTVEENGQTRYGFMFNPKQNPDKRLPELYALHIRKAKLELEDPSSIFIQDLYKFYLRASLELLSKYFEKRGKYMFLYEDQPLFRPGTSLEEAEDRIRNMRTRARMQKKRKNI